jgi:hypothetical protein
MGALLDEVVCLPLTGAGGATLRAFCLSVLWQICETLYLFLADLWDPVSLPQGTGMQVYNSSGAGLMVLSMGDGILAHLPFRSLDPTSPPSETSTQLLLGRGAMII